MSRLTCAAVFLLGLLAFGQAQTFCACKINSSGSYLGEVATRAWEMDYHDTTNREVMSRITHYMRASVSTMQVLMPNYFYSGAEECADGSAVSLGGTCPSATIDIALEYPSGTCTRITYSGQNTATTTGPLFPLSDAVSAPPLGAEFWIRSYYVGTAGIIGDTQDSGTYDVANVGVSGITDQTTSCDTVSDTGNHIHPAAIVGTITQPSVTLAGDSIMVGDASTSNAYGDNGPVAPTIGPSFGYIMMATGGDATTANQTPEAIETSRASFNSALRAGTFIPNGGQFDVNSVLGTGTNYDLWIASPTQYAAAENPCIHPSTAGNTQVQNSGIINVEAIAR